MAKPKDVIGAALVVGGGIAGVQASLDLAESGFKVYLVEEKPCIGGVMAQLDKTFPTNDCSACIFSPKLQTLAQNPNIEILAYSHIERIEGEEGNFKVKVRRKARYVDQEKCTSCGTCAQKCPTKVPNEYNFGHDNRKAIYKDYAQGIPSVYTIDTVHCRLFRGKKCGVCKKVCLADAVDYEQQDVVEDVDVGAVVLAPGYELFDTGRISEFGHGRMPNVVTNLEMERILSASGPFEGVVTRPSDGAHPHKIAWIQCVASRDLGKGLPYCSSVCCMASIKEAVIAKEHDPNIEPTIFYMDIRAYGKDFDAYYERARKEGGVRFLRSMVSRVVEDPLTHNLNITYLDENQRLNTETFDMVILAVGLKTSDESLELAEKIGVNLNESLFCSTTSFEPVATNRPGIFAAGMFQGPKDIPQTVIEASAAAGASSRLLASARHTLTTKQEFPPQRDVSDEEPRIGVFICRCGINIANVVNVPKVVEHVRTLPNVVFADEKLFTCSQDTQEQFLQIIEEHKLNRIVVSACSPRTHEPMFQLTME
ncbi:MAG: FAD-dependent oxidoreductase, partial [Desulfomonile sp.]